MSSYPTTLSNIFPSPFLCHSPHILHLLPCFFSAVQYHLPVDHMSFYKNMHCFLPLFPLASGPHNIRISVCLVHYISLISGTMPSTEQALDKYLLHEGIECPLWMDHGAFNQLWPAVSNFPFLLQIMLWWTPIHPLSLFVPIQLISLEQILRLGYAFFKAFNTHCQFTFQKRLHQGYFSHQQYKAATVSPCPCQCWIMLEISACVDCLSKQLLTRKYN